MTTRLTTRRIWQCSLGALVVAGAMASVGCEALGLGKDKDKSKTADRGGDRISRRSDDSAVGGGGGGRSSISSGARKVREGVGGGERLTWRADRDGRVYALDVDADRVVYTGAVRRDDELVVDPAQDRADLNGRPVTAARLAASHRYNLYFDPDETR